MTQVLRRSAFYLALLVGVLTVVAPIHAGAQEAAESSRRILTKVPPTYPAVARRMQIQGNVKVAAVVAANGSVKSVEVKGGHPMLAQAAQQAVLEWRWEPSPKETREVVEIKFNW
jgi:TonB family protein